MALAVGTQVYLDVDGGVMSDAPLFGVVDIINGDPPDVVRALWENGATQYFSTTDQSLNRLVDYENDANQADLLNRTAAIFRTSGVIKRSFFVDPGGANVRTVLLVTPDGRYIIASLASVRIG